MSSNAAPADPPPPTPPTPLRSGKLPRIGKHVIKRARIAFGGALPVQMSSDRDVELYELTEPGATGSVTFTIDGSDTEITLGWRSVDAGYGFKKYEGDEIMAGRRRIVINDSRDGDDEGEED